MEYSRVVKFKDYRDSFTKENSVRFDSKGNDDFMSSTTALPYDEVIKEVDNQKEIEAIAKKEKFKRIYMMVALIGGLICITIALIFLGILAFGRK